MKYLAAMFVIVLKTIWAFIRRVFWASLIGTREILFIVAALTLFGICFVWAKVSNTIRIAQ